MKRGSLARFAQPAGASHVGLEILLNKMCGLEKILGHGSSPKPSGTDELAVLAFPGSHKDCFAAGAMARLNVRQPVSHHVRAFQRQIHVASRPGEHANSRFSAGTVLAKVFHDCIGMVKTIIGCIQVSPSGYERDVQLLLDFAKHFGIEVFFGDSRLIGDDYHWQPKIVEKADRFGHPGKNLKLRGGEWRIYNAGIFVINKAVDHAVTVEKNCWCLGHG